MSSSGNTPSVSASASVGWSRTNNAIRSVVSHALALPLVLCLRFFDDVDTTDLLTEDRSMSYLQSLLSQLNDIDTTDKLTVSGEHFMSYLQSLVSSPSFEKLMDMAWLVEDLEFMTTVKKVFSIFPLGKLHSDFKNVFNVMRSSGRTETALVADILKTFRTCQEEAKEKNDSASSLLFQSEGGVRSPNKASKMPYRYDLLVARDEREGNIDTDTCTPIMLLEFGLDNSIWWQKLDQACKYLELLTSPENIDPIKEVGGKIYCKPFGDKPMLMSTITIDKKTGAFQIALFLCCRREVQPRTTDREKMEAIHESMAQLSVSEKPKKDKDLADGFDMVLLWHTVWNPSKIESGNGDYPGSNEFAKALVAIFFAMQCMEDWQRKVCSDNFLVLGPNCCKVKLVQVR
jgi:hypothetical protein